MPDMPSAAMSWRDHAVRLALAGPELGPLALVLLVGLIAAALF
jgi:hypothetical protein